MFPWGLLCLSRVPWWSYISMRSLWVIRILWFSLVELIRSILLIGSYACRVCLIVLSCVPSYIQWYSCCAYWGLACEVCAQVVLGVTCLYEWIIMAFSCFLHPCRCCGGLEQGSSWYEVNCGAGFEYGQLLWLEMLLWTYVLCVRSCVCIWWVYT